MTEKEILENNMLIAEFMGGEYVKTRVNHEVYCFLNKPNSESIGSNTIDIYELKYHKSWDWLMPVVEQIESLDIVAFVTIQNNYCGIAISEKQMQITKTIESDKIVTEPRRIYTKKKDSKIRAVYNVVVRFIKWYDKQNKDGRKEL